MATPAWWRARRKHRRRFESTAPVSGSNDWDARSGQSSAHGWRFIAECKFMSIRRTDLVRAPLGKQFRHAERRIESAATAITRSVRTGRHQHLTDQAATLLAAQRDLAALAHTWDVAVAGIRALGPELRNADSDPENHTRYITFTMTRHVAEQLDCFLEFMGRAGPAQTGLPFETVQGAGFTTEGLGAAYAAVRDALIH